MKITLKVAGEADRPVLENLMQLYIHDFSEFILQTIGEDGRYSYPYLAHYWHETDRFPLLIQADEKLAGFALVRRETDPEDSLSNMDMAEFFILRSFRRAGVGSQAAIKIWDLYPESWHLRVLKQNKGAYPFWKELISDYTDNKFEELTGTDEILFTFGSGT